MEYFTIPELKFIKERTADASPRTRLSAAKLAKLPEMKRHTKGSIAVIIKKNNWANPVFSARVKSGQRLSESKKLKILEFLKNSGRFWPTHIIAEHFGASYFQTKRLRRARNLQLCHSEEAMKDPMYRKWYNSKEKKRILNLRDASAKRLVKRQDDLELFLKEFVKKNIENLKWKICRSCNKRWPATADFFRITRVKFKNKFKRGETYLRMIPLCVACPAKRKK